MDKPEAWRIEQTRHGKRTFPMTAKEAQAGLDKGELELVKKGLYLTRNLTKSERLDVAPEPATVVHEKTGDEPQTYQTKDMVAEPGKRKRARPRPRKSEQA